MKKLSLPKNTEETPYQANLRLRREQKQKQYIQKRREARKKKRDESLRNVIENYQGEVKEIPFARGYYAFDDGRIYSYKSECFKKPSRTNDGYEYVGIMINNEEAQKRIGQRALVHRIMVQTYLGEIPEGHEVNHKNHVRDDNRIENLEIITISQNRFSRRPRTEFKKRPPVTEETRRRMSIAQKARFAKNKK